MKYKLYPSECRPFGEIAGAIGDRFPSKEVPEFPMFSFDRPSNLFWQGYFEGLREKGLTAEQAFEVLQSSTVRHQLDWHEDKISEMGKRMAKGVL